MYKNKMKAKRTVFSIALVAMLSLTSFTAPKQEPAKAEQKTEYVYVCKGKSAKRYHASSRCKGLKNCKSGMEKVTLDKAKKMGRTACRICY